MEKKQVEAMGAQEMELMDFNPDRQHLLSPSCDPTVLPVDNLFVSCSTASPAQLCQSCWNSDLQLSLPPEPCLSSSLRLPALSQHHFTVKRSMFWKYFLIWNHGEGVGNTELLK